MPELQFEWDPEKAAQNFAVHGVTFEAATNVFLDPFAQDWLDEREDYGEERFVIIGMAEDHLLFIRIISARGAEPHERRQYHEENG